MSFVSVVPERTTRRATKGRTRKSTWPSRKTVLRAKCPWKVDGHSDDRPWADARVGQATKGVRWMLWESTPRKDVVSHETHRGAAHRL